MSKWFKCFFLSLFVLTITVLNVGGTINSSSYTTLKGGEFLNISLLQYNISGEVVEEITNIPPSTIIILNIIDIPIGAHFVLTQAHAFQHNVTLSYNNGLMPHSHVNGTDVGLVQVLSFGRTRTRLLLHNFNTDDVYVLIGVQAYGYNAPIPGGCNMEFSVETAPYLRVGYTSAVVRVDSQPAAPPNSQVSCEKQAVHHDTYHMYLPEKDFSIETYFDAIRMMMTVSGIERNAAKVDPPLQGPAMRRVYSAYPGTGSVYGLVATYELSSAAYVPAFTYACGPDNPADTCEVLTSTFSKILCATIFFLGLFACLFGHVFFKTEMFLLGFLAGSLVTYIVFSLHGYPNTSPLTVGLSVMCGIPSGGFWLLFWWFYGIPVVSVLLATLTFGYVMTSVIFYAGLADLSILESDLNFWLVFSSILLVIPLILTSSTHKANILSCSVLGAYAVIIPVDHYLGSNMKYIVVNTIRRATVTEFQTAVVDPPFQLRDMILTGTWMVLVTLGIAAQWCQQAGKPPFPPPPYRARRERRRRTDVTTDRTPLLAGVTATAYGTYEPTFLVRTRDGNSLRHATAPHLT